MRFAVLLNEDYHVANNFHSEGMDLLSSYGQVDLVTMPSGQEAAAFDQFMAHLKEAALVQLNGNGTAK